MPEDKSPEEEIYPAVAHETQRERLEKNRFYNSELDRGDPTPHWMSEIEAFLHLAFWLLALIAIVVFAIWMAI